MKMSNRSTQEFRTLVFFDLETTGLFAGPQPSNPHVPPRSIPGDRQRDLSKIFKTYAQDFDTGSQYLLPRMTEISFVIMSRATYVEGIQRMHNICLNNEKTDLKVQLPTRIYCQQFNPELSDEEWRAYEQNRNSMTGIHLKRSTLLYEPTFAQSWPLIHALLSSFEGPVALIAHNGLRFDCRVLLAELRRTELLEKYPIPSSVYFMDSYLGFLDLEKGYHDEIATIMTNINWRMITNAVIQKRSIENFHFKSAKKLCLDQDEDGDRQPNNIITLNSDDDIICDDDIMNVSTSSVLERPKIQPDHSPPRNVTLPNEGWKTAPAKLALLTAKDYAEANPLNFMKIESWSPAKRRRMKDEFFERKNNGDWLFSMAMTNQYFHTRGNFRLIKLYTDIIQGAYLEHRAFDDCIALMNVCLSYGKDFLEYVDSYSSKLEPLNAI